MFIWAYLARALFACDAGETLLEMVNCMNEMRDWIKSMAQKTLAQKKQTQQSFVGAFLILALAIFLLGAGGVFTRFSEGSVFGNIFFRMIFALPFYGLILVKNKQHGAQHWQEKPKVILMLVAAGMFFGVDMGFFFSAINYTGLGYALLIGSCTPLVILPLSVIFYREWPPLLFWPGMLIAVFGMYLAIGVGGGVSGHPEEWKGYLFASGAMVAFGVYLFLLGRCHTNMQVWHKMTYITASAAVTVAVIGVFKGQSLLLPTGISWLAILGLSLNSQMIGQSMIAYSIHRVPVNLVSVSFLAMPFAGSFYGWLFFDEVISTLGFIGMLICLSGIYCVKRAYDNVEKARGHDTRDEEVTVPQ